MLKHETLAKYFKDRHGIDLRRLDPSDPIYSKGPSVFFGKRVASAKPSRTSSRKPPAR